MLFKIIDLKPTDTVFVILTPMLIGLYENSRFLQRFFLFNHVKPKRVLQQLNFTLF